MSVLSEFIVSERTSRARSRTVSTEAVSDFRSADSARSLCFAASEIREVPTAQRPASEIPITLSHSKTVIGYLAQRKPTDISPFSPVPRLLLCTAIDVAEIADVS